MCRSKLSVRQRSESKQEYTTTAKRRSTTTTSTSTSTPSTSTSTSATPDNIPSSTNTTGPNAFSFLMEKAAAKPRREVFLLMQNVDGTIKWKWETVSQEITSKEFRNIGGPETKWTARCTLKDRSLDKPGIIFLGTNIPSGTSLSTTPTEDDMSMILQKDRSHWFSPSHLKSALQKNIRRRRPKHAVKCAVALMRMDMVQFVRRMMIIVLEDSILHPSYPLLAWLLLATSKDYVVSNRKLFTMIIDIVHQVAASNCRDPLNWDVPVHAVAHAVVPAVSPVVAPSLLSMLDSMASSSKEESSTLIRSILCRQRFGGMNGDMKMLERYAYLWYHRFEGKPVPPNIHIFQSTAAFSSTTSITSSITSSSSSSSAASSSAASMLSAVPLSSWHTFIFCLHQQAVDGHSLQQHSIWTMPLQIVDIPPSAIDFHCCPTIIKSLSGTKDNQELKSSMWMFSSSTNHKLCLKTGKTNVDGSISARKERLKVWRPVQKQCMQYQRTFIKSKMK